MATQPVLHEREMEPQPLASPGTGSAEPNDGRAAAFTDSQRALLETFLGESSRVSQALAADNPEDFGAHFLKLSELAQPLRDAFPATSPLSPTLQRLAAFRWRAAKDLADARKQFLPFSTTVVDLARALKGQDKGFIGIKIYHCPMAPEPGLWMQAEGPLRNPFFGTRMLACGEIVQ